MFIEIEMVQIIKYVDIQRRGNQIGRHTSQRIGCESDVERDEGVSEALGDLAP